LSLDLLSLASVQIAFACIAVWAVCRLFPRMSANWRCWLWRLVGIKCIAALWLVPLPLPIDRATVPAPAVFMTANTKYAPIRDAIPGSVNIPESAYQPQPIPQTWRNNVYIRANNIMLGLSALWWIGFGLAVLRAILALRKVKRVLRTAYPHPTATAVLNRVQERTEYLQAVRIKVAPDLGAPAVVGLRRPTILLPVASVHEDETILESAIAHELAHVRRKDLSWVLASEACRAIFWFHPLIWLACREQHAEAEIAADKLARQWVGKSPREYGRHLLVWLDRPSLLTQSPGLMLSTHELGRRLKAMSLNPYRRTSSIALGALLSIPLAVALVPVRFQVKSTEARPKNEFPIPPPKGVQNVLIPPMRDHKLDASEVAKDELQTIIQNLNKTGISRVKTQGTGGKVYSAPLDGGGKVELLGLTHIEPKRTQSWSADGTPLPTILPVVPIVEINSNSYHEIGKDGKERVVEDTGLAFGRQALLRFSTGYAGANAQFVAPGGRPANLYSFSNTMPIQGNAKQDRLVTIEQAFQKQVRTADLVVNYYRPLKSLGKSLVKDGEVIPGAGTPDAKIIPIAQMGRILPFGQRDFRPRKDALVLSVAKPKNPYDQMRAVIYKKDGHNVWGPNLWSQDMKEQPDADSRCYWLIEGVKMSDIAEIRFAETRYEMVIFKNVQMHPVR